MYYELLQNNKRRIVTVVVLLFVLLVAWSVMTLIDRQGKVAVVIRTVPGDASILFNKNTEQNGTRWIKPGDYTVVAKKDGFSSVTRVVRVTDEKSQNIVAISLQPESDQAKEWAAKNTEQYQQNETFGTIEANANGEYFSKLNPITTKLPFVDPYFKIAYVTNADQSIKITVSTPSPRYRFYAVEKIRELGYDPTDFVIEFKDFKNPLEKN
jgi:hypothetical protein